MKLKIGDIGIFHPALDEEILGVFLGYHDHTTFNCIVKFANGEKDFYTIKGVQTAILRYKELSG